MATENMKIYGKEPGSLLLFHFTENEKHSPLSDFSTEILTNIMFHALIPLHLIRVAIANLHLDQEETGQGM